MFEPYKKLLTIGITAYNEEKYIKESVESCVEQAGTIIICDNASTDNTKTICEELAKKHPNIIYHRLENDLGRDYGFNYVLLETKTKYFMWCGPHDLLDKNYTSGMIHMLENSDAVGCFPSSRAITPEGEEIGIYDYWYHQDLISDSASRRVYSLIRNLHELGGLYGIFKTETIKKYPMGSGLGGDHPTLCNIAKEGKIIFYPRSIFNFRNTRINLTPEQIDAWRKSTPRTTEKGGTYQFMAEEQLKILKSCKARDLIDWVTKLNLTRKAKKKLKKRFGY